MKLNEVLHLRPKVKLTSILENKVKKPVPVWFRRLLLDLVGAAPDRFVQLSDKTYHSAFPYDEKKRGLSVILGTKGSSEVGHVVIDSDGLLQRVIEILDNQGWNYTKITQGPNDHLITVKP